MPSAEFLALLDQKRDARPRVKVEFTDLDDNTTDITRYYESGAAVDRTKERAPDEIQAGDFDVVLFNHDDTFSEFKASSLLFGIEYHGAKIVISAGFQLADGSVEYEPQITGFIDELQAHDDQSKVTLRCRDRIRSVLDEKLHAKPFSEVPVPDSSNVGDGSCSTVETKPFKTVDETWTFTCTTPGADGVAQFSVVGSVTGSIGPATSGTEFSTAEGPGGIKFTLRAGSTAWASSDKFTLQTRKYPQFSLLNPGKIIWSILTGYNWDTDTVESWADFVFTFDHTKTSANEDLDYDAFADVIAQFSASDAISGYIPYNQDAASFLEGILILFLGSLYTGGDGRIILQSFRPTFETSPRNFADSKKVKNLGYNRTVNEVINYVVVDYKRSNVWEFSDEDIVYDGAYVVKDQTSIDLRGKYTFDWKAPWFSPSETHAQDFANRLVLKFTSPPLVLDFDTGVDALLTEIGDKVTVTDDKYGLTELNCEVSQVSKVFDEQPVKVHLRVRRDGDLDIQYGFLGSRVDEGDGLSPQASTFGAASESDKTFCYLTDGYRMF